MTRISTPQFKSLLKHHWLEEAQHTKLDTLVIEAMSAEMGTEEIEKAVDEYIDIGGFLDAGMQQQAKLDIESFVHAPRAAARRGGARATSEGAVAGPPLDLHRLRHDASELPRNRRGD